MGVVKLINLFFITNQQMKANAGLWVLLVVALGLQVVGGLSTHVTCLYDIKRGSLKGFERSFEDYLFYFDQLLQTDSNLIVFGDRRLEELVWQRRRPYNTVFVLREIESFRAAWFYPHVQAIRQQKLQDPSFREKGLPQYALEYYNLIMFSKLYMLEEALRYDKFGSDFLVWTDAGLNHIFTQNMVYPENHLLKWFEFIQPQWLFFSIDNKDYFMDVTNGKLIYRQTFYGGFFGGHIDAVRDARCTFQNFLRITLQNGFMISDESIFDMMPTKYPYLFPIVKIGRPDQLYKRLLLYNNFNRKQETHRIFRGSFDNQGNLYFIENKTFAKYVTAQQDNKLLPVDKSPIQAMYEQMKQFDRVLGESLLVCKQIFYREAVCFIIITVVYVVVMIKQREQKDDYTAIYSL